MKLVFLTLTAFLFTVITKLGTDEVSTKKPVLNTTAEIARPR